MGRGERNERNERVHASFVTRSEAKESAFHETLMSLFLSKQNLTIRV